MAPSGRAGVRALGALYGPDGGRRRVCGKSPGPMRRGTAAGGTTALTDASEYPPARQTAAIVQTSRIAQFGSPVRGNSRSARARATPWRMSRSDATTASAPNASSTSSRIRMPGTIDRRAVGVQPGDLAGARRAGARRAGRAGPRASAGASTWPSMRRGVVGLEREVDRRARGRGPGDGDELAHGQAGGHPRGGDRRADVGGQRGQLRRRRRVVVEVALAVADDADLQRGVEAGGDELGRAAADVDHEQPVGAARRVAPANVSAASSSPERIRPSRPVRSRSSAANSRPSAASRTADVMTASARSRALAGDRRRVVLDHAEHPLPRVGRRRPPASRPSPSRVTTDSRTRSVRISRRVDVGDEQAGRVRSDVDHGGPHARPGTVYRRRHEPAHPPRGPRGRARRRRARVGRHQERHHADLAQEGRRSSPSARSPSSRARSAARAPSGSTSARRRAGTAKGSSATRR